MENPKQKIELEYVVAFEDGLKPQAGAYYLNDKGEVVLAVTGILPEVSASLDVLDADIGGQIAFILRGWRKARSSVEVFPPLSTTEDEVQARYRQIKANLIKVQGPEQVGPALREHTVHYTEQFGPLIEDFVARMTEYLEQNPGYFPDIDFSKLGKSESPEAKLDDRVTGSEADKSGKQGENQ
jgi:hypothetical protein